MTTAFARSADSRPADLESVRVADAMHVGVVSCAAEAPLTAVARILAAHRIHAVVVDGPFARADGAVRRWGIVADLDLAAAALDGPFADRCAADAVAVPVLEVSPDDTVGAAARLMCRLGATHVLVVERGAGRPAGVLSTLDVADVLAELPVG